MALSRETSSQSLTILAGEDLSALQYRFLNGTGHKCGAGLKALGVVQNNPAEGAAATVQYGDISTVVAGGIIAAGAEVEVDANGEAVTLADGISVGFYLGTEACADGDLIAVLLK